MFLVQEALEEADSRPRSQSTLSQISTDSMVDDLSGTWNAVITSYEQVKQDGKDFVIYHIQVTYTSPNTSENDKWTCSRRYSEFHDLHMQLKEKYPEVARDLVLPGKKLVGSSLSRDFLEKRKVGLDQWLKSFTDPRLLYDNPTLRKV